jgi:hypothetical protein
VRTRTKSDDGAWAALASDLRLVPANCSVGIISSVFPLKPLVHLGAYSAEAYPCLFALRKKRCIERAASIRASISSSRLSSHEVVLPDSLLIVRVSLRARRETSVVLASIHIGNHLGPKY